MTVEPVDVGWRGDPANLGAAADIEPGAILRRLTRTRPPWMAEAACGHSQREALQVCGRCPVLADCREWAIADPSLSHGVLGGMSARARRAARLVRRRREVQP